MLVSIAGNSRYSNAYLRSVAWEYVEYQAERDVHGSPGRAAVMGPRLFMLLRNDGGVPLLALSQVWVALKARQIGMANKTLPHSANSITTSDQRS